MAPIAVTPAKQKETKSQMPISEQNDEEPILIRMRLKECREIQHGQDRKRSLKARGGLEER